MDYTDIPFEDCQQGSEGELLLFALDRVHRQFAWKSGNLDAAQLQQKHPPSKLTIAWTIKHLASVEAHWTALAQARPVGTPWEVADRTGNTEEGLDAIIGTEPDDLYRLWYDTIDRCRAAWVEMIADDSLATTVTWGGDDYVVNRRRALVDILEENLLHTGQTSIIRESIDGLTGNDPP